MAHKKVNAHRGPTWQGLYTRRTKTLAEKRAQADRRAKQRGWDWKARPRAAGRRARHLVQNTDLEICQVFF